MMKYLTIAALMLVAATPVAAQEKLVRASDPAGMMSTLEMAGYNPELTKDQFGDPEINLDLDGWGASIAFYGCNEETHQDCESIQFIGGFDTNGSFSADQVVALSNGHRYSQITIDDEGDVWVRWDILTGDGISPRLFLQAVRAYSGALSNAGVIVFPEDAAPGAAEAAADAAADAAVEAAKE